jgi:hypothetical protein
MDTMKTWMKRCVVALLLFGFVASAPLMVGCQSKQDKNKASKDFQKDNLDPTKVKMEPLTGPGGGGKEAPKKQ